VVLGYVLSSHWWVYRMFQGTKTMMTKIITVYHLTGRRNELRHLMHPTFTTGFYCCFLFNVVTLLRVAVWHSGSTLVLINLVNYVGPN